MSLNKLHIQIDFMFLNICDTDLHRQALPVNVITFSVSGKYPQFTFVKITSFNFCPLYIYCVLPGLYYVKYILLLTLFVCV
jgi:hypothetical protein